MFVPINFRCESINRLVKFYSLSYIICTPLHVFLNSWLHVLPMHNLYVVFILFLWQYNITISYSSISPLLYSINKYIRHSFIQWNLSINRISLELTFVFGINGCLVYTDKLTNISYIETLFKVLFKHDSGLDKFHCTGISFFFVFYLYFWLNSKYNLFFNVIFSKYNLLFDLIYNFNKKVYL